MNVDLLNESQLDTVNTKLNLDPEGVLITRTGEDDYVIVHWEVEDRAPLRATIQNDGSWITREWNGHTYHWDVAPDLSQRWRIRADHPRGKSTEPVLNIMLDKFADLAWGADASTAFHTSTPFVELLRSLGYQRIDYDEDGEVEGW